jgi:L-lactate dehydrogenase complex protein LldG
MSRENILKKIKTNKPGLHHLPEIDLKKFQTDSGLEEEFVKNVEAVGGKIIEVANKEEIKSGIKNLFPDAKEIVSLVDNIDISTINPNTISSAKELEKLELAIIKGEFVVAENGAVWLSDRNFSHRSIPFITSHLIIVLDSKNIVENMHEAFSHLKDFNEGYGVFISGPSKTADIEQSLVIGAQAALGLTVFIVKAQ